MGSQFSEEFLLGYRAGHQNGFADAVRLMRDAVTLHQQGVALAQREDKLAHLLSGGGLVSATEAAPEVKPSAPAAQVTRAA